MDSEFGSIILSSNQIKNITKIIVSEEIFLALRPRADSFRFDERNLLSVAPALIGYQLLLENDTQKPSTASLKFSAPLKVSTPLTISAPPPGAIVIPQNLATKNLKASQERFAKAEDDETAESETDFENCNEK